MTQLVTFSCNQCEQNNHIRCPAESLVRQGFIERAGDHCLCAYTGHQTPQTTKESPVIKSMLGRQDKERDIPVSREVVEEKEADSIEGEDD